jgi:hypothetical protein
MSGAEAKATADVFVSQVGLVLAGSLLELKPEWRGPMLIHLIIGTLVTTEVLKTISASVSAWKKSKSHPNFQKTCVRAILGLSQILGSFATGLIGSWFSYVLHTSEAVSIFLHITFGIA